MQKLISSVAIILLLSGCTKEGATEAVGNAIRSACQSADHCTVVCKGDQKPDDQGVCQ